MSKEKVVLAYSGGLDTTAIIPWLKETYDYDVVCCCVDCGQGEELDGLEERALYSGASKLYIEDITDDFCENYIMPCVQADAVYLPSCRKHRSRHWMNTPCRMSRSPHQICRNTATPMMGCSLLPENGRWNWMPPV